MTTSEPQAGAGGLTVAGRGLSRWYSSASGAVHALAGVDASFGPGRLHVIAGPSGAGKSTLLRLLALLERPDEGTITVGGVDVTTLATRHRRRLRAARLSHLFQRPTDNLVTHLDAVGNVVLAARLRGIEVPDPEGLLAGFGLGHRARALPAQLSGGEQQRLAVAATFASRPAVLTADEPTAELDHGSAEPVVDGLRALARTGCTVIVTSHDPTVVAAADDVIRLRPPEDAAW